MIYILYTAHRFSGCGGVCVLKKSIAVQNGIPSVIIIKRLVVLYMSQQYSQ